MEKEARIYVAGHRGLAGSAIVRRLTAGGYSNIVTRTHAELDLAEQPAVRAFFERERPQYVFLAAAKVGGILANDSFPAQFIQQNLAIQSHVIHESWRCGVQRLLFLGSSCVYPRECPQPIREEYLLTGPLEATNRPYAVAKIAGIEMCWAYRRQYGATFLAAMPTNLYGPGDNYDLQDSHVLPALIRKFHEAKIRGEREVVVWGSGTPRREFLHSDDMADACVCLMNLPQERIATLFPQDGPPLVNIGCGEDLTIAELARMVKKVVGFPGEIRMDRDKPDGTPRKLLDVSRMASCGWKPRIRLEEGLRRVYDEFCGSRAAP